MKKYTNYTRIVDNQAQYELDYNTNKNITGDNIYKFQPELFQQLITQRRYEEAYEYGSKFKRNNPEEDRSYKMDLYNLRREGRKESHFYSQIQQDPDMMYQAEFYRNVFENNGLSTLVDRENMLDNPYARQFIDAKKRIGSQVDQNGNIINEATKLSVTFKPKGSSWFLVDWLTGTDEDVDYLELFYTQSGLSEKELIANGIDVSKKDGNTTIIFDKSNPIANRILYGLDFKDAYNKLDRSFNKDAYIIADTAPIIESYDKNFAQLFSRNKPKSVLYAEVGKQLADLSNFRTMIEDARFVNAKAEEFVSTEDENEAYQGFAIPLSKEEVKNINMDEALHVLSPIETTLYTDGYNENDDKTLRFVEQTSEDNNNRKIELMNYIKSNSDRAHYAYGSYGNEIGMLITIDPYSITSTESNALNKSMDLEQGFRGKEVRVFIPGLYSESAEEAINKDSQIRAIRESNDMQRYGYKYKLYNGKEIAYNENGSFVYQDTYNAISQEEAIRLIHKSQLIEDSQFLKYEYINNNNQIYDYASFDNQAKQYAISAAMSLNPGILQIANINNNIVFVDRQGNPITIKDIFDKKGGGSAVLDKYSQFMNYSTLKFYEDCFDIYMEMIIDSNSYK